MTKILLIDDEEPYLENLNTLLEEEGFETVTASNGMDAIDAAKSSQPDLIICDIMLPDISGYMILEELRKRESTSRIPFIFLTAKAEMTDLRKGMNLGADDYLTKPFSIKELKSAISTRLKKRELLRSKVTEANETDIEKESLTLEDHLFLPSGNNYEVVLVKDIECIISDSVYTNVYCKNKKKVLVRKLLKEWEKSLPEKTFLRVRKSAIINLTCIKKVDKWFNNTIKIVLESFSEPIIVSRKYKAELKKKRII